MKNRRLVSPALQPHMELIGNGLSFTRAMRNVFENAVLFDSLAPADTHSISTYMHAYRVQAGVTIFAEGEPNGYLCVVAEGLIGVYGKGTAGNLTRIKTIQSGEIFGKTALIEEHAYSVSLVAETKCVLLVMSRENFRHCVDLNPALGMRILLKIAQRLNQRLCQPPEILAEYVP